MSAITVIPVRLASTRLPRKTVRKIAGQSLIGRVYYAVRSSSFHLHCWAFHQFWYEQAGRIKI
jgi:CMP-2-keto-3-deoxyoctulosonic acid synthetase